MRRVVRAGLVVAGAFGLLFALASMAQADVVDPSSPVFQPGSASVAGDVLSGETSAFEEALVPATMIEDAFFSELDLGGEAVATPAPEQVVTQAPTTVRQAHPQHATVLDRAVEPLRAGFRDIGAFLGRVASACQVGLTTGTGGPVLVLAVLGMLAPFIRRRVFGIRWATDEDAPELLYAREIISPG